MVLRGPGTRSPNATWSSVPRPMTTPNTAGRPRSCRHTGANTACELMCRKILMHIAVDVAGGKAGDTFAKYIEVLAKDGHFPPALRPVVDLVRRAGQHRQPRPADQHGRRCRTDNDYPSPARQ